MANGLDNLVNQIREADVVTSVVSAVVRDRNDHNRLMLGVRRPVQTSERHPGVLSTFTMRVPVAALAAALFESGAADLPLPTEGEVIPLRSAEWELGQANGFASTAVFLIEALLARKLGMAEELVNGRVDARATTLGLALERVEDPKGGFPAEHTMMLTYLVTVDAARFQPASGTSSYRPVEWVDGHLLQRAVRSHDALLLLPNANPFDVCLHGLCVRSAAVLLDIAET